MSLLARSLFRAATQEEALTRFEAFTHRVPNFVQMVKEMYNVPGLQKVTRTSP